MKVIAYTRVSSAEQQASGLGLAAQRQTIEAEAERRSWQVEWVTDTASGSNMKRPGIAKARQMLRDGEAQALCVSKLDRVSRSLPDFADLMRDAKSEGWHLIALDLGVDSSTRNGRLIANLMASVASWEREAIGDRTREALAAAKARGAQLGRPRQIPARTRSKILRMHARGMSLRKIAAQLNAENVATARGGQWQAGTVHSIVTPPSERLSNGGPPVGHPMFRSASLARASTVGQRSSARLIA